MPIRLPSRFLAALALSLFLAAPGVVALAVATATAQTINYPDDRFPLRDESIRVPGWNISDSLFPDSPSGNTVTVSGDTVPGRVEGGLSNTGDVSNNRVTVSGGTVNLGVYGGLSGSGAATGNSVVISGGTVNWDVYGGYVDSGSGAATGNSVFLSGGTVNWDVYGGRSLSGAATGNSVTISGGTVNQNVLGGSSNTGAATGNSVTITGGTVLGWGVAGGSSNFGAATGNSVVISGGTVNQDVFGGYSGTGAATGNSVTISGGMVNQDVSGGWSYFGTATDNSVTISGGTVNRDVYGGGSNTGAATGNSVTISGGTVNQNVYGGYVDFGSGAATGNSVVISGGTVNRDVFGGYSGTGAATGNSVAISGGTVNQNVYGGYVFSGSGSATGNSVTISGGTVNRNVHGGWSQSGAATGNSVTISGGTVNQNVFGGYVDSGSGAVTGNSVTISGGTVNRYVYGGVSSSGAATGNTITITGSAVFSPTNTRLVGGSGGGGQDSFSGNTLNLYGWTGTVNSVLQFETINFALPASLPAGGTVLTTTTGAVLTDLGGSGRQSTVNVGILGGGSALAPGDSVRLIQGGTLFATPANTTAQGLKGVSLLYDFDLATQTGANGSLTATVRDVRANPQAKSLAEGRLSGLIFTNQGLDLLAYQGLRAARGDGALGLTPFVLGAGNWGRYNTGSHIDTEGFSLLTGLAWNAATPAGALTLGAFFEAGWGGYDSYNSFSRQASVHGDGDTQYTGGGILGRFELPVGLYVDASARMGWVDVDHSSNLRDSVGNRAGYDSGSMYYGAHGGLGYIWKATDKANVDVSTKYLWTRQDSDTVTVVGDRVKFKTSDSQRWRTGARASYAVNEIFTPYAGAYYEHEFDGKAKATAYGYNLDAPDLKGGTGIGEIGMTLRPVKDMPLSVDLGLQGYMGTREGVTGSFQLKYEF